MSFSVPKTILVKSTSLAKSIGPTDHESSIIIISLNGTTSQLDAKSNFFVEIFDFFSELCDGVTRKRYPIDGLKQSYKIV